MAVGVSIHITVESFVNGILTMDHLCSHTGLGGCLAEKGRSSELRL